MPNWVDNVVILDFTKASDKAKQYLERLLAYEQPNWGRHADERPGLFGMFLPRPEILAVPEVLDELKVEGNSWAKAMPDWYKWSIQNWGTKWDVPEFGLTQEGDKVRLCFSTANSDPDKFLHLLHKEGVLVEAYAAEPGCDWAFARMGRLSHEFTNICDERERFDEFPELKDILRNYWECADAMEADEAGSEEIAEEITAPPTNEERDNG